MILLPGGAWLRRVTPRIWKVTFPLPIPANCWLIREPDGLTVVDAAYPGCGAGIVAAARALHQPVRRLVVTHAHPDHAGAMAALEERTGATVLAHPAEIGFLTARASLADAPGAWLCRCVLRLGRLLGMLDVRPVRLVEPIAEGDCVGSLQVLHTPGHTPGSISLWNAEDAALFCGDNATLQLGVLHLGVPWFTLDARIRNQGVARCAELPARHLLGGHGPVYRGDVGAALRRLVRRGF